MRTWPPERLARLRKLAADGLTFTQIAVELGCSLGMISGKCHRERIAVGAARKSARAALKKQKPAPKKKILPLRIRRHYSVEW